jgi:hypothetical protein
MSSVQSDATGETGLDIRIDTEVLEALSVGGERAETEPKISRWLDCWRP